jgi:hypothetical protein
MNTLPETIDVAGALRLLSETYPSEEVQIEVHANARQYGEDNDRAIEFQAWVGDSHDEFSYGTDPMDAAKNLIEKAGKRDANARLKVKLAAAQKKVEEAQAELLARQIHEQKDAGGEPHISV